MSKALITESILTGIADAIRTKTGETAAMKPTDMAAKIEGIVADAEDTTITSYIDNEIEVIGDKAFQAYPNLKNVTARNCTVIGAYAFADCPKITEFNGGTVSMTGSYAFANCTNLDVLVLKITNPGVGILKGCKKLTATATAYWSKIPDYAFSGCVLLGNFAGIIATSIGAYAYSGCVKPTDIDETKYPKCTSIGQYAFENCIGLASAIFRAVTNIGEGAFSGCTSLTSLELDNAYIIAENAFSGLSNCTVHFGTQWQSKIESATGYSNYFGGTNLTFVFDLGDGSEEDPDFK